MQYTVLALDIGSTRLKAALVDARSGVLASKHEASPLGEDIVDAEVLLRQAAETAARTCGVVRPDAIAVTGATRSLVCVAGDGSALGPIIKLDDPRGAHYGHRLQSAYQSRSEVGFGAFHPLARALDVRDREPERYARMRWLLELKDWINLRLTGQACCDSVAFARIQPADGAMDALLARLGLKPGLAASPQDPAQCVGCVGPAAGAWSRWQGVPVVQCGFDAWCASFGLGCVREHAVYNVSGTTEVFGSFCSDARLVPGVPCLPWGIGLHHLGGPCLTGLGTLAWFGSRFLGDPDPQVVLACAARAGEDVPLCVPFFSGERMPFWRADLRGSFIGVHSQHGVPEFARALVDGLLVFQRWLLRQLVTSPEAIYLTGGGALLPGWAQLKASAFAAPVRVPECDEPGLLGAAMCAQVALGACASLRDAQQAWAPAYRQVAPEERTMRYLQALEPRLLVHFP